MFAGGHRTRPRRGPRIVLAGVGGLVLVAIAWAALLAGLWTYAWVRLGADPYPSLAAEVAPLGAGGASAPVGSTTVLVVLTGPVDPTEVVPPELAGPVVLVQFGGPRDTPVGLVLPAQLPVGADGTGPLALTDIQRTGGPDLLIRSLEDYTQVRIDHVVRVSSDALPRILEALGGVEVCDDTNCRTWTAADAATLTTLADLDQVRVTASIVQAAAARFEPAWVVRSPLTSRRVLAAVAEEVSSDVSLRGSALLTVTDALTAVTLQPVEVPYVIHPGSGALVPLEEPMMVRFQHLRDGTPLGAAEAGIGDDVLISEMRVAVLNGAGIAGLATRVEALLEVAGYRVVGTGNAPAFDRADSVVAYLAGDDRVEYVAVLLAERLGGAELVPQEQRPSFEGDEVDLLVTVGQDLQD
jgi:hypothetical protein